MSSIKKYQDIKLENSNLKESIKLICSDLSLAENNINQLIANINNRYSINGGSSQVINRLNKLKLKINSIHDFIKTQDVVEINNNIKDTDDKISQKGKEKN